MKKNIFALLILLAFSTVFSQSQQLWKGYFSYNEIKDLSESPDKIYAASENALFTKNNFSGEIKTYNTIDGLSGQTISAMYHSETSKKTIFGYENGLMVVRNEIDGSVLNVVDIINKSIPQNVKKVNHFMEYQGILYVSCDFGIVQYNLATLQFGDTYFIGNGGSQIIVNQTAVFEDKIYAATQNFGIKNASISNANLNDYNQWTTMDGNGWKGIASFENKLLAITWNGNIQKFQSGVFVNQISVAQNPIDFRVNDNHLIVTTQNHVYVYNSNLGQVLDINSTQITAENNIIFSCATVIDEKVFIGTKENGIYSTDINDGQNFENTMPTGPYRNQIFRLTKTDDYLWAVYGGFDVSYNPYAYAGGIAKFGISKFSVNENWTYLPYSNMLGARALSRIIDNPKNPNQLFISSSYSGLLKFENEVATNLYNATNTGTSGLQAIPGQVPDDVRVFGSEFDSDGNLWLTSSFVEKPLITLKSNGTWQSYTLQPRINNYTNVVIDKNNTKWVASSENGVYAFNEKYNNKTIIVENSTTNVLGSLRVRALAIDNNNKLWIGTGAGLKVVQSVDEFLSNDEIIAEPIIILEDGLAQELLYEQFINDIYVDGSNNKWIATNSAGVFKFSSDGQNQLAHYTISNSPLPSNNVMDIEIDMKTGEVFLVTDKGMVSYKGTATSATENLENVYIYPNPVRPEFSGTVKISGLLDKATVKITDIGGNLVYETTSEGGTIEWDTSAFGKYKVASGVYMVFISAEDGVETKVKKVMIIR